MTPSRKSRYLLALLCVPAAALLWTLSTARLAPPPDPYALWRRVRSEALACARSWPELDGCFRQGAPRLLPSQQPPWAPPLRPTRPPSS